MECAGEPDQRVARLAHCRDGHAFAGVTIVAQPMTARPEPSCAILRCEGRQRPHDIDLKLLAALDRRPKIMVTVGILGERVGVYLDRSEEHTSELQSLMRISYAVFCLKK